MNLGRSGYSCQHFWRIASYWLCLQVWERTDSSALGGSRMERRSGWVLRSIGDGFGESFASCSRTLSSVEDGSFLE